MRIADLQAQDVLESGSGVGKTASEYILEAAEPVTKQFLIDGISAFIHHVHAANPHLIQAMEALTWQASQAGQ